MKTLTLFVTALISTSTLAQMPLPLYDSDNVVNPKLWKTAEPVMQAALECRKTINPADPAVRPLLHGNLGRWEIIPPNGFAVFGLPVQTITITIAISGTAYTAHYTASVAAPLGVVINAANFNNQHTARVGDLLAQQGSKPSLTNITCTVSNSSNSRSQFTKELVI